MARYVCSVCGYIYDEAVGSPETNVAAGTTWAELPADFACPLCGAAKADFVQEVSASAAGEAAKPVAAKAAASEAAQAEMSALELSALCSNLARGFEKQYQAEGAQLFTDLAEYFKSEAAPAVEPGFDKLLAKVEADLEVGFPEAKAAATTDGDRGALRALTWSEKVTRITKSILTRYQKNGESMLEEKDVYVCSICGFIFIGDTLPEICPVCKVPNWKFDKIEVDQTA